MLHRNFRLLPRTVCLNLCLFAGMMWGIMGCTDKSKPTLLVYSDLDRRVVDPLVQQFQKEQQMDVQVKYAEPKTVQSGEGLSSKIREEGSDAQVDAYWANDQEAIWNLQNDGLLYSIGNESTVQVADKFREPKSFWVSIGARVRVLLYNKKLVNSKQIPQSLASLSQEMWKGRCGIADPRTNSSSRFHFLYLLAILKEREVTRLLEKIKGNAVQLLPDENAVVEAVASGKLAWGVVDSDLAKAAMKAKKPVAFVIADQVTHSTADAMGLSHSSTPTVGTPVLLSPFTVFKTAPHRPGAKILHDFLLSQNISKRWAELQPDRLPTQNTLLEHELDQSNKRDGTFIDILSVNTLEVSQETLISLRPQLLLLLKQIFP